MKRIFQNRVILFAVLSYLVLFILSFTFQTTVGYRNVDEMVGLNVTEMNREVRSSLQTMTNSLAAEKENLLTKARILANLASLEPDNILKQSWVQNTTKLLNVSSICISDGKGILVASTIPGFLGFDMSSTEQSRAFMQLCKNPELEIIQDPMARGIDRQLVQYAGVARRDAPGFVQVCIEGEQLNLIAKELVVADVICSHTVGRNGMYIIVDSEELTEDSIVLSCADSAVQNRPLKDTWGLKKSLMPNIYVINGQSYYVQKVTVTGENRNVFALADMTEMFHPRNRYMVVFTIVYSLTMLVLYIISMHFLNRFILNDMKKINGSLERVMAGDPENVVFYSGSPEVTTLTDSINTTVSGLRKLLSKSSKRAAAEAELSRSILATTNELTPPFYPDVKQIDLHAMYQMSDSIGADCLVFEQDMQGFPFFFIADASGSGVSACLYMTNFRAAMQHLKTSGVTTLQELGGKLNEFMQNSASLSRLFISALFVHYDPVTHQLEYLNAGYFPPFIRRKGQKSFERMPGKPGAVISSVPSKQAYTVEKVSLEAGDMIFLVSDGVVSQQNKSGRLFTRKMLEEELEKLPENCSAESAVSIVNQACNAFRGGERINDDILMIAMLIKE